MNKNNQRIFAAFWIATILSGCADLVPIREYAAASSELASGKEIVNRWKNSDVELVKAQSLFEDPIQKRRSPQSQQNAEVAAAELIKIHDLLAQYFKAVALLADGELPSTSKQIDNLSGSIKQLRPDFDPNDQKAFTSIANLLSKPLAAYRQRKVIELIQSQDDNVARLLAMLDEASVVITRDIQAESEASAAPYMFLLGDVRDRGVRFLVKDRMVYNQKTNYEPVFAAIQKYRAALLKVNESHKKIAASVSSNKEIFRQTQNELKDVKTKIETARSAIELAMQNEGQ